MAAAASVVVLLAAAAATRSGHQETDVNGGKVYVLRMLVLVFSSLIKGPSIYGRL